MIDVCLIGYGAWGKKVFNSLRKIKKINKVYLIKNRREKVNFKLDNIDWIFVTTSISNHYRVVQKFLKKKINVFCEKPLTKNYNDDIKLYRVAKKNNCKLYVSDIENFKVKKIKLIKKNIILRSKFSHDKKNIIERLAYHDFTYLYVLIKNKNPKNIKILKNTRGELNLSIKFDRKLFILKYNLNINQKKHSFNNVDLTTKKNILKKMLLKVIQNKVNFAKNKKISLFASRISKKINEKI
tara:strand:- start:80 stop:799 length:720 start_codon:yes stop_codon:yes gene_type:complete